MFYKYSVWKDYGDTFFSNVTTEKAAIQTIIFYYGIKPRDAAKMWIKENEFGTYVGRVRKSNGRFIYREAKGKEYPVNMDGTPIKKTSKENQFGLDFYLGK